MRRLANATLVILAGLAATPAHAQAQDAAALARLVADQARLIQALEARVSQLEARASTTPAAIIELPAPAKPQLVWNGGGAPLFASPDGQLSFRTRGRIAIDFASTRNAEVAARNISGTEARIVRLGAEGDLSRSLSYVLEADFADDVVTMKSVFIAWSGHALGRDVEVSLGNRLMDRAMEGGSPVDAPPFMERNAVANLSPQKGFLGLGVTGKIFGDGWHATMQVAGDDIGSAGEARDSFTVSARAHWNPILTPTTAVHLGGWAFQETLSSPEPTVSRSLFLGSHFNDLTQITTGAIPRADRGHGEGIELGAVAGRFWTFAEAGRRTIDSLVAGHVPLEAQSLSAGLFLTKDRSNYSAQSGAFSRFNVQRPLSAGGTGAWEVLGRVDHSDYTGAPVGGLANVATLAINWYPERTSRFSVSWLHWKLDARSGDLQGVDAGDTFAARAQVAF